MMRFLLPNAQNRQVWQNALLMLAGVFYLDWRPEIIIFAFVFEGFILGFLHLIKLYTTYFVGKTQQTHPRNPEQAHPLVAIPVFMLAYFIFACAHLVFMFVFLMPSDPNINNPIDLIGNTKYLFSFADMRQAFLAATLTSVIYTIVNFFFKGKFHYYTVENLLTPPYVRVLIQQVVTIASGWMFMQTGGILAVAFVIIFARFTVDSAFAEARKNGFFRSKLALFIKNKSDSRDYQDWQRSLDALLDL